MGYERQKHYPGFGDEPGLWDCADSCSPDLLPGAPHYLLREAGSQAKKPNIGVLLSFFFFFLGSWVPTITTYS